MNNADTNQALTTEEATLLWALRNEALVELAAQMAAASQRLRKIQGVSTPVEGK